MQIVSIHASPRRRGLSSTLHDGLLRLLRDKGVDVQEFFVDSMDIHHCTACGSCREKVECIFHDDMTSLYELLPVADAVTVSTPVYFTSVPGPFKTMLDRFQPFWEKKQNTTTEGSIPLFIIMTAGSDDFDLFEKASLTVRHAFSTIDARLRVEDSFFLNDTDGNDSVPLEEMLEKAKPFLSSLNII